MKDSPTLKAPQLERRRIPSQARPKKTISSRPAQKNRISALAVLAVTNLLLIAVGAFAVILICNRAHSFINTEADPPQTIDNSIVTTAAVEETEGPSVPAITPPDEIYAEFTNKTKYLTNEISSEYAILIDLKDNTVLASKHSGERIYPASMTKVMTLIAAAENIDLTKIETETFTLTPDIINPLVEMGASRAGFVVNEKIPIKDLFYGAILPSGADATIGLALYTSGSEEAFTELMNETVRKIGLKNTNFKNNTGLHSKNHYSTVHDIALIMKYAMQNEFCAGILTTKKYVTTATVQNADGTLYSTTFSRMYGNEAKGVTIIAGKTGFTNEGLNCLVTYAVSDTDPTRAYICCTAYASSVSAPAKDCIYMYSNCIPEN